MCLLPVRCDVFSSGEARLKTRGRSSNRLELRDKSRSQQAVNSCLAGCEASGEDLCASHEGWEEPGAMRAGRETCRARPEGLLKSPRLPVCVTRARDCSAQKQKGLISGSS